MKKLFALIFATAITVSTASGAFDVGPNLTVEPVIILSYDLEDEEANSTLNLYMNYDFSDTTTMYAELTYDVATKKISGLVAGLQSVLTPNVTARGYFTVDEYGGNDDLNVELEIRF
jgi:hypothetical protein